MTHWTRALPLAGATLFYLWTAWEFHRANNWPMTLVWICYAVANIGYVALVLENRLKP